MKINEDILVIKKSKSFEYMQYKRLLDLGINHAYIFKSDKVDFKNTYSDKEFESLRIVCDELDMNFDNLKVIHQTHTDNIKCVTEEDIDLESVDGVMTDHPGIPVYTKSADCLLALMYDPKKKVLAAIHSGWRGTFQRIFEKAVLKMAKNYGSNPSDIIVALSPCIKKESFEVGEEVGELCKELFGYIEEFDKILEEIPHKPDMIEKKFLIDLTLINYNILKEVGIKEENIIDCCLNSYTEADKLYSYRREKLNAKRNVFIATL